MIEKRQFLVNHCQIVKENWVVNYNSHDYNIIYYIYYIYVYTETVKYSLE